MASPVLKTLIQTGVGVLAGMLISRQFQPRAAVHHTLDLQELNVQRINIREADGTLRLVLSSRSNFPGLFFRGKEHPHDRQQAGLVFLNDEGTENGGLIFAGRTAEDGQVKHGLHLSFDQYEQDQVLQLTSTEHGQGDDRTGSRVLMVTDRPQWSIEELVEVLEGKEGSERQEAVTAFFSDGRPQAQRRLVLGKREDQSVGLQLHDSEGRVRAVLQVNPDGRPSLRLLDAEGQVVNELSG